MDATDVDLNLSTPQSQTRGKTNSKQEKLVFLDNQHYKFQFLPV